MDLKVNFNLPLSVKVVDKYGNPAGSLDAPPSWSLSDDQHGSLAIAPDALSALFSPDGHLGALSVGVQGQAGGQALSASLDLNLIPGDAASLSIEAGAPIPQA